jgi:electron transport complex protein RnfG
MKKGTETLRMVMTLVIICVISAASLSLVYQITEPKIRENQLGEMKETLERILPEAVAFDEPAIPQAILDRTTGVKAVFIGLDDNRSEIGTAVIVEGPGYQDFIRLFVAFNADLTVIKSVEVLDQQETPGLGSRIEEEGFIGQFKGDLKDDYDSITGATVSSTTVIDLVGKALEDLKAIKEGSIVEVIKEEVDAETEASPEYDSETQASPKSNETINETGEENESGTV